MDEKSEPVVNEHEYDMQSVTPTEHKFDHIIGNQLQCSLHENCVGLFVPPTQLLERNEKGELVLVDAVVR